MIMDFHNINHRTISCLIFILFTSNHIAYCTEDILNDIQDYDTWTTTEEPISAEPTDNFNNKSMSGNVLWDNLLNECSKKASFSCIQKNVYSFLNTRLEHPNDLNVTQGLYFRKNKVDYTKYSEEMNRDQKEFLESEWGRAESPLEEVSGALYGKGVKFMMTHDMEIQLPDTVFDGATFRVSPRGFEGTGTIVKLELIPMTRIQARDNGEGRIFIIKKIKQFLKNKLMMAFIAAVLIINLIKFKLLFLLPMMMGVGTAKKIMLKVLLFLFPALGHIFKLCHYYHSNYHGTKFHHHQHHIKHLHHTVPHTHYESAHPPIELDHPPLELDHPPYELSHPPHELPHPPPAPYHSSSSDYEFTGPGFGYPSVDTHRNSYVGHKPKLEDLNEINAWGLGVSGAPGYSFPINPYMGHQPQLVRPTSTKLSPSPGGLYPPGKRLQAQASTIAAQYGPPLQTAKEKQIQQAALLRAAQIKEAQRLQSEQQLRLQAEQKLQTHKLLQQQQILQQQQQLQQQQKLHQQHNPQQQYLPHQIQVQDMPQFDAFYSPILVKIDAVLEKLGYKDEPCKERILCAMYRNPARYSPHSNLVSAELSRDPEELQKPAVTNAAVVRFYRYVQAARDGQDGRECSRLYPQCPQIQEPA